MSGKIVELDLFRSEDEVRERRETDEIKAMIGKSFRNLFARTGEVETEIMRLKEAVDELKLRALRHG